MQKVSSTMRCPRALMRSLSAFALLSLFPAGSSARGDLTPLGFPTGNELADWSTAGDPGTVAAINGQATLAEPTSPFTIETDLSRTFLVPTGAQTLQFTIESVFADSTPSNGVPPD